MNSTSEWAPPPAPLGDDRRWQARPDLLYRRLVDGGMVYDSATRRVHHLNASAATVWETCGAGATARAIVARLCGRFEIDEARALSDAAEILGAFAREGLLRG
ncbi:MAG: PqqD family protein [Gemmatimonadota bacterium]